MKLMINAILILISIAMLWVEPSRASDNIVLKEEKDRTTYSVGFQIGEDLKKQNTDFDPVAFKKGVEDALSDAKPYFSAEEMRATLAELKKKIVAQDKAKQSDKRSKQVASKEKNWAENRDFLAANAKKEGVVTLPSGLQYKVLTEGIGRKPGLHDTVVLNYRGTLIDGTEFGRSREGKPVKQRVDAMISGMKEALPMMKEGAKWRIFVPADLAYGERGPLAERAVIIDIELISVEASK
jgi:FKBP-type peptidyl-prolyl cis-trans isomerase FklB